MAAYRRDVLSLPLAPSVRQKLKAAGFDTARELSNVGGAVELATGASAVSKSSAVARLRGCVPPAAANISHEEALAALRLARREPGGPSLLGENMRPQLLHLACH